MPTTKVLTNEEIDHYDEHGYLKGCQVFNEAEVAKFRVEFERLASLVPKGMKTDQICQWHQYDRFLYNVCTTPRLLDYVEDLIGPNFYLWGSHLLAKAAHDPTPILWHQDAFYWPLTPRKAVSVWVAFTDSIEENGCMRVVPKTHRTGVLKHRASQKAQPQGLWLQTEKGEFDEADAVNIDLKAGEISLHDDHIVHGSKGNKSDRWRIGLSIRYSPSHVKCNLNVWPTFVTYPVRGNDWFNHNPPGAPPQTPLRHFVLTMPAPKGEGIRERVLAQKLSV